MHLMLALATGSALHASLKTINQAFHVMPFPPFLNANLLLCYKLYGSLTVVFFDSCLYCAHGKRE